MTGICLKCGASCEELKNNIMKCTKCEFKYEFISTEPIRHKSFRKQHEACVGSNICKYEFCVACGHELCMCLKFGGQCASHKCKEERKNVE